LIPSTFTSKLLERGKMLSAKEISFEYDNLVVLHKTSISINEGDRIGLVGPNGAGKSTLLKILAGIYEAQGGKISRPNELTVGYLPQEIDEYSDLTCIEFLEFVTGVKAALTTLEQATNKYSRDQSDATLKQYERAYSSVESLGAYTLETRVGKALDKVGLSHEILHKHVAELSGGQKTKLALSAILLARFSIFLLDEPTNNLDLDGLAVLEKFIIQSKAGFVIVSHDRRFLRKATTKIAELLPNKAIRIYSLGYDEYLDARRKQQESDLQRFQQFNDEKKRLQEAVRSKKFDAQAAASSSSSSDSEKVGRNARKEKAVGAHARAATALASRVEKLESPDKPQKDIDLNFRFDISTDKLSSVALEAHDATIYYENLLMGPYCFQVGSGDKVVIIGPNGGGKSTLLKMIAGAVTCSSGFVAVGQGYKIGYIDQEYSFPNPKKSVVENLVRLTELTKPEAYNILARFNIKKESADMIPVELSPGQRSRALLAGVVAGGANLLLLDEPTNHLDIPASDELQAALAEYKGTLIVVTHDRELIDSLKEKRVIVVADGHVLSNSESIAYLQQIQAS